ncbi:hypothetical protein UCRPA7_3163 [Phaeoacremonium minimum UCRPA7]|uniref:DUF7924 domain-containing protein n=1 Tax=Phaeoacremonium minimum (strain UCR-PA7) TaxID=1286976 RepID=R8BPQ8_PHAM7|nr:hypothetical protein UCRPA7_3163 [Phaeoacremonium minimum UCRPA7]EOO01336.1 hypothetical protein UCRPA7_3163 [Phaeoacremonium minimum UCRPA7]
MDKKQVSPELSQAELLPTQEEQVPANPPSRKRQIDSDSDAEPLTKRARLTQKNLALFDKIGKKKTSDPTDDSKSTQTTSTTSSGFADKARHNRILHPLRSQPPINLDDIREQHAAARATASPPESVYGDYVNRIGKAGNKATMVVEMSDLLKRYDDKEYNRAFNRSFTNVPLNAGYNNGLSAPQPDFVEGLEVEEYRPFPIDKHVPGATLYQDDPFSLTLPHVAGEWKGSGKDMDQARLQSAYDGAAMVYARTQALSYMGKSDPPGHAAITTFTTDGTNLIMYAHYAIPSEEDEDTLEYHQYQYASTNIKDSHQGHKDGRKGLRNAQDHAKDQSYALKDQLKEHWKQRSTFHPIADEDPLPVPGEALGATSADEEVVPYEEPAPYDDEADEDDYEVVEPCQPTPAASAASRKASHSHSSSKRSHTSGDGDRKRKASPPPRAPPKPRRSKAKPYWVLDDESGEYYHKHSDGTTSWFNGDDDNED